MNTKRTLLKPPVVPLAVVAALLAWAVAAFFSKVLTVGEAPR